MAELQGSHVVGTPGLHGIEVAIEVGEEDLLVVDVHSPQSTDGNVVGLAGEVPLFRFGQPVLLHRRPPQPSVYL